MPSDFCLYNIDDLPKSNPLQLTGGPVPQLLLQEQDLTPNRILAPLLYKLVNPDYFNLPKYLCTHESSWFACQQTLMEQHIIHEEMTFLQKSL